MRKDDCSFCRGKVIYRFRFRLLRSFQGAGSLADKRGRMDEKKKNRISDQSDPAGFPVHARDKSDPWPGGDAAGAQGHKDPDQRAYAGHRQYGGCHAGRRCSGTPDRRGQRHPGVSGGFDHPEALPRQHRAGLYLLCPRHGRRQLHLRHRPGPGFAGRVWFTCCLYRCPA